MEKSETAFFLTYDRISAFLDEAGALLGPTEVHGIMCGFVCAGAYTNGKLWLEAMMGAAGVLPNWQTQAKTLLLALYEMTSKELKNPDADFQILLPTEETSLNFRAQAVGEWCTGVILGLKLAGIYIENSDAEDIRNALFHIAEFANIDYRDLHFDEDDEVAYKEVVEYLRMTMLMFYQEFTLSKNKSVNLIMPHAGDVRVIH